MRTTLPYVTHFCRNDNCNNCWLAPDETNVTSRPPRHKYCLDCELFFDPPTKDPARVARGKALAAARKAQLKKDEWLDDL